MFGMSYVDLDWHVFIPRFGSTTWRDWFAPPPPPTPATLPLLPPNPRPNLQPSSQQEIVYLYGIAQHSQLPSLSHRLLGELYNVFFLSQDKTASEAAI